jgi:probable rRNA maturation factor
MIYLNYSKEVKSTLSEKAFSDIFNKSLSVLKSVISSKMKGRNSFLDLTLIDDKKIKLINRNFRNINKATDVLSFAYLENTDFKKEKSDIILGDIFISIDTAKKQAKIHKHSLTKEMQILFVHGLLHVFGFDHNTDEEENQMEEMAKKILNKP